MAQTTSSSQSVFRWSNPYLVHSNIMERQSGYNPDLSSCGIGTTCDSACGNGFITCNASTNLALFCYNPSHGQSCCNNGDGQACDAGYYCARDISNATWCCQNKYDLAQCASMYQIPILFTGPSSTSTMSSTTYSAPDPPPATSPEPIPTTTTSSTSTYLTPSTTPSFGYFNSTFNSTPSAPLFTNDALPYTLSLNKVRVLGLLLFSAFCFCGRFT